MNVCKACGTGLSGNALEFCSWACKDNHLASLKKKMHHAVRTDVGHTQKLSKP